MAKVIMDSTLTFSQYITILTHSSYFQLRHLRAIRKSVSIPSLPPLCMLLSVLGLTIAILFQQVFLKLGQPPPVCTKLRCSSYCQTSSIFSYIVLFKEQLHWLPISARIEYKVLLLILKAQLRAAPKYLQDFIRFPFSATSLCPLCTLDRRDLLVPQARQNNYG